MTVETMLSVCVNLLAAESVIVIVAVIIDEYRIYRAATRDTTARTERTVLELRNAVTKDATMFGGDAATNARHRRP